MLYCPIDSPPTSINAPLIAKSGSGASAKHLYNHFGGSIALDLLPVGVPMSTRAVSTTAGNLFRRFGRNRRASAAVEFALVAPVFLGLLFAILETGIMFFAGQYLETITQDGARIVMTGQAQNAGDTQAAFHSYICNQVVALFTCANIFVDVRSYTSFQNVVINSQISGGAFVNNMQYNPGGPGDVVVVRLFYQWPQIVTGLGYNITNLNGNFRLLSATAAFRNEPYPP
jgi:Flp pilus assembly protein TadG